MKKGFTKKTLQSLVPFANGNRLTAKQKKEISAFFAKHRGQRKTKKAA